MSLFGCRSDRDYKKWRNEGRKNGKRIKTTLADEGRLKKVLENGHLGDMERTQVESELSHVQRNLEDLKKKQKVVVRERILEFREKISLEV